nr:mitochondrial inner membrane protease ATP23-like [Ipomoea batatas]
MRIECQRLLHRCHLLNISNGEQATGRHCLVVWRERRSYGGGRRDPKVKFLREQLEKAGCKITDNFFKSVRCDTPMSGFFCPKSNCGIQVCANNLRFQDEVTQVLIHELIHAYDQCRTKNMDWGCRTHRACTEVYAPL